VAARTNFTTEEARRVGEQLEIDWDSAPFDVEQFRRGMDVELEHASTSWPRTCPTTERPQKLPRLKAGRDGALIWSISRWIVRHGP
jgi:hypothetical protein